jgi:hypothetical protein
LATITDSIAASENWGTLGLAWSKNVRISTQTEAKPLRDSIHHGHGI